jgi:beta-mannosidase
MQQTGHPNTLSLNGNDWRLGSAASSPGWTPTPDVARSISGPWRPARVPGNVRLDLHRVHEIPDPWTQPQESAWVDAYAWCYERAVDIGTPQPRTHLVLEGVDYISWVYLNGQCLSPEKGYEGMFGRQLFEITDVLSDQNTLSVWVQGSDYIVDGSRRSRWERLLDRFEWGATDGNGQRFQTVKCQMSFGWDFAPCVRTMGIWDDVYLVCSGDLFIRDLRVRPLFDLGQISLAITLIVDARRIEWAQFRLSLSGATFDCLPQIESLTERLQEGLQTLSWTIPVRDPHLWWPWDHGRSDLYWLTVEACLPDGSVSDVLTERVGLRQISVLSNPGAADGRAPWMIHVNGSPVYIRGANWVPADILPGRVTAQEYLRLLQRARDAHMNMLRVWGGGLREKRAFYDLCDEMGLLVWQEFPFACAFLSRYPADEAYLDLAESESREIVRALRNHPSVGMWCGGNEFHPARHQALVDRLAALVSELDGTRPFYPASPYRGDVHNWDVWHGLAPVTDYVKADAQFSSEFGLQSPPEVESLHAFIPSDELWPPGPAWEAYHAQMERLMRYASPILSTDGDMSSGLEAFVRASQRAQGIGLQIAIEHARRKKYAQSGTLVWQLNEPCPAISWSLIDYYGRPKWAYDVVRRVYNPLLVTIEYPVRRYKEGDLFLGVVWVINDRAVAYPGCCVEVRLWDVNGEACESWLHTLRVEADSTRPLGEVAWVLPQGGGWQATARLFQDADLLSENEYDLCFYDAKRMPLLHRLSRWIGRAALELGT